MLKGVLYLRGFFGGFYGVLYSTFSIYKKHTQNRTITEKNNAEKNVSRLFSILQQITGVLSGYFSGFPDSGGWWDEAGNVTDA
jgi:formate-dependent nitrite reductase membrane component NrfD